MIKHAVKLFKQLETIPKEEVPVMVPVFNLVSYAKFIVNELENYNINSFIICDNNSTYPPMVEYLEELSKTHRVVRFEENLGPRVFAESKEFLSIMPEYFIVTDPDLIFNKDLPTRFLEKMRRILDMYQVSKTGFAIDIEETKDKFFDAQQVARWEGSYWKNKIELYPEKDPLYLAPIDTTFCMYKKQNLINELKDSSIGITNTTSIRIAGRFTCEHMGWWKEQPVSKEELDFYHDKQVWASTYNQKKLLGFIK